MNASIQQLVVPVHIAFRPSFGSADGFWLHGYPRLLVEMGEDEHQQQNCQGREAGSSSGSGLFYRFHNILPRKNQEKLWLERHGPIEPLSQCHVGKRQRWAD